MNKPLQRKRTNARIGLSLVFTALVSTALIDLAIPTQLLASSMEDHYMQKRQQMAYRRRWS